MAAGFGKNLLLLFSLFLLFAFCAPVLSSASLSPLGTARCRAACSNCMMETGPDGQTHCAPSLECRSCHRMLAKSDACRRCSQCKKQDPDSEERAMLCEGKPSCRRCKAEALDTPPDNVIPTLPPTGATAPPSEAPGISSDIGGGSNTDGGLYMEIPASIAPIPTVAPTASPSSHDDAAVSDATPTDNTTSPMTSSESVTSLDLTTGDVTDPPTVAPTATTPIEEAHGQVAPTKDDEDGSIPVFTAIVTDTPTVAPTTTSHHSGTDGSVQDLELTTGDVIDPLPTMEPTGAPTTTADAAASSATSDSSTSTTASTTDNGSTSAMAETSSSAVASTPTSAPTATDSNADGSVQDLELTTGVVTEPLPTAAPTTAAEAAATTPTSDSAPPVETFDDSSASADTATTAPTTANNATDASFQDVELTTGVVTDPTSTAAPSAAPTVTPLNKTESEETFPSDDSNRTAAVETSNSTDNATATVAPTVANINSSTDTSAASSPTNNTDDSSGNSSTDTHAIATTTPSPAPTAQPAKPCDPSRFTTKVLAAGIAGSLKFSLHLDSATAIDCCEVCWANNCNIWTFIAGTCATYDDHTGPNPTERCPKGVPTTFIETISVGLGTAAVGPCGV